MQNNYDIVIVGGGMVGASLAVALSDSNLRILLLDLSDLQQLQLPDEYDLRVSAITQASRQFFQALGIWEQLQNFRVAPFREMQVWEKTNGNAIHFDGAEIGAEVLGDIIENRAIQYYLLEKIKHSPQIDLVDQVKVKAISPVDDDCYIVELENGQSCQCNLLVGADGGRSAIRTMAGIETSGWAYDQSALVATVKTELSHAQTAWQCFLKDGPLAFLPLADPYCSIVWSTSPEHAQHLLDLDNDAFACELTDAFDSRLGKVELCSDRAVFPLQLQHATSYVKPGLALIGDAAHSIHPLAGQGVNLGFLDAASLVDIINDANSQGKPLGNLSSLRRYERWRKGDNLAMMFAMDAFKRVFGVEPGPVQILRDAGMKLTDSINPLKNMIMNGAAGMRGELPSMISKGNISG